MSKTKSLQYLADYLGPAVFNNLVLFAPATREKGRLELWQENLLRTFTSETGIRLPDDVDTLMTLLESAELIPIPAVSAFSRVVRRCYQRKKPFDDPRLLQFPQPGDGISDRSLAEEYRRLQFHIFSAYLHHRENVPRFAKIQARFLELSRLRVHPDGTAFKIGHDSRNECMKRVPKIERRILAKPWKPKRGCTRAIGTPFGEGLFTRSSGAYTYWLDLHLRFPDCGLSYELENILGLRLQSCVRFCEPERFESLYADFLIFVDIFVQELIAEYRAVEGR